MSKKKIRSIQCTSCGAPLSLYGGGHKIKSLNCRYCGAVMDAHNEYKVLAKFSEQQAPFDSPLQLGAEGKIKGVRFTVIGIIEWQANVECWIDYQLFSPTHGYAWLSYEMGHWVFTRRSRDLPNKSLWSLNRREPFEAKDKVFYFYEAYAAEITYVVGELTWIAKLGDQTRLADGIAPPYSFSAERSEGESEYYFGEYIDADDIHYEFGSDEKYLAAKIHPLMPYRSKILEPLAQAAKPFVWIAVIAYLFISFFMTGSPVNISSVNPVTIENGLVKMNYTFTIDKPKYLVKLEMDTSKAGELKDAQIIEQKTGKTVIHFGKKQADGSYKIDARIRQINADFLVPNQGVYTLSFITMPAIQQQLTHDTTQGSHIRLFIKQAYINPHYFMLLLLLSGGIVLIAMYFRWSFEAKRWQESYH